MRRELQRMLLPRQPWSGTSPVCSPAHPRQQSHSVSFCGAIYQRLRSPMQRALPHAACQKLGTACKPEMRDSR